MWLHEALSSPYNWLHVLEVTNILADHQRFPDPHVLLLWQRKYRFGDISFQLLTRDINAFFRDETCDLHQQLEQLEYVVVTESVHIEPDSFVMRWHEAIHTNMYQLLAVACACKQTGHPFTQKLHIVTSPLTYHSREIEVVVIVVDALPESVLAEGHAIAQKFPLLLAPDDLFPLINVMELWVQGEKGFCYAIEQYFKKYWQTTVDEPMSFCLGTQFITSISDKGLETNDVVLAKIVRAASAVIAGQAGKVRGYKLHQLRKDKAGDAPQQTREIDGAKAWRLDLTTEGAGWRMHYWQITLPDGRTRIEFSNILKEQDPRVIY